MPTMANHAIKINRALRLADVGRYPETARAMLRALPASALDKLSAREIAEMLDAMHALTERSKAIAERDACEAGLVWDARRDEHRELAA